MFIVVTGAFGVLGRTVCAELAARGYKVVAIDYNPAPETKFAAELVFGAVDLSDASVVESISCELQERGIALNGLVNIAGGFVWETFSEGSLVTWHEMWQRNLVTALNSCKAFLRLLKDNEGSIVNIGAAAADRAAAGMGAYTASKSALVKFGESLDVELGPRGLRVNSILPTIIDTPLNRQDMPTSDFNEWVTPKEVTEMIVFLLSDKSSGVKGAAIRMGR